MNPAIARAFGVALALFAGMTSADSVDRTGLMFPTLDSASIERIPRASDSDPSSRHVVDYRLSNRHHLNYSELRTLSRHHETVPVEATSFSDEQIAAIDTVLAGISRNKTLYLIHYGADDEASPAVRDQIAAMAAEIGESRPDLTVIVDHANQPWPSLFADAPELAHSHRLELLYITY